MNDDRYPLHHRSEVAVAGHMEEPSLRMAGATMRVETDALQGRAAGSLIDITGRVLGVDLAAEEVVTGRIPPLRKTWKTRGEPRLLLIGAYRMGVAVSSRETDAVAATIAAASP
jgi:hypothetical protein